MEKTEKDLGLTVKEVLTEAYYALLRDSNHKRGCEFPVKYEVFITDDGEYGAYAHNAFMKERAVLIQIKNKLWLIANGNFSGNMSFPFDSDIMAVPLEIRPNELDTIDSRKLRETAEKALAESPYFYRSLVFSTKDGLLYSGCLVEVHKNPFEDRMKELLLPILPSAVTKQPENPSCLDMDYKHRAISNEVVRYKPGFPKELSDKIHATLVEMSRD